MKRPKRKLGRPPLPKGEAKGRLVLFRATDEDVELIKQAAEIANVSMSQFIRDVAVETSKLFIHDNQ